MTSWSHHRIDLFVLGSNSVIQHKWWSDSSQSWTPSDKGWMDFGKKALCGPVAIARGPGLLDVFALNFGRELWHKSWDGKEWSSWKNLKGTWAEHPSVVSWGEEQMSAFLIGTDRSLYHKWLDGASWIDGFENLGGPKFLKPITPVARAENCIDLFGLTIDHRLVHRAWGSSSGLNSDWEDLGGPFYGQPKVVSWDANRIDVFAVGAGSAVYTKYWDGSKWSKKWESLGDMPCREDIEVVSWGPGFMNLFVIGIDRAIYHKSYNAEKWRPDLTYEPMGGHTTCPLSAVSKAFGRIDLFHIGKNSACYLKAWNEIGGGSWKPGVKTYYNLGGNHVSSIAGFC